MGKVISAVDPLCPAPERPSSFGCAAIFARSLTNVENFRCQAPPRIDIELSAASESDLIEARGAAPDHDKGKIDLLLKILRDGEEPPAPLKIQIVNSREIGSGDRFVSIRRDDKGKLSGLVAMNAPFSET